jgi:Resolvase, N terminal domain
MSSVRGFNAYDRVKFPLSYMPARRRSDGDARLDRLARSTRDLLNILDAITKAGAGFKSLGDACS